MGTGDSGRGSNNSPYITTKMNRIKKIHYLGKDYASIMANPSAILTSPEHCQFQFTQESQLAWP